MNEIRTSDQQLEDAFNNLEENLENIPIRKRKDIAKGGVNDFLGDLVNSFYWEKLKEYPALCQELRKVNFIHQQELEKHGVRSPVRMIGGKMSGGTSGWSKDMSMKFKWIIPTQLKFFMRNLVFIDFWEDTNKKTRDFFVRAILRGEDCWDVLRTVQAVYGQGVQIGQDACESIQTGS